MASHSFHIAPTSAGDLPAVEAVHRSAFPTELEARLVRLLICHGKGTISLAAVKSNQTVGHILFSPASCDGPDRDCGLGLAPLAVLPDFHRQGIGSALVEAGLAACRQLAVPWVVVLGDPMYYRRFGFIPASRFGLTCEFGGDDAFQIAILSGHRPPDCCGHICYADEFREFVTD